MSDTAARRPTKRRAPGAAADETVDGDDGDRVSLRRSLIEQEIYSQAIRLFAERGFAGTNFQDIADAVGLTRPALYHYVKSKDDLLATIVAETTQGAAASISQIVGRDDLDARGKLHEIARTNVIRQAQHRARFQLLVRSEASLPEAVAATHRESQRRVLRLITTLIQEGIASGVFRATDARVAALGVLGLSNWVSWWYNADHGDDLTAISEELADMAVAGLETTGGQGAPLDSPTAAVKKIRADLLRLEGLLAD